MELIGVPRGPVEYDLQVMPEDAAALKSAPGVPLDALCDKQVVGVAVGAGSGARRWPPDRFADVIESILTRHPRLRVVLLAAAEEAEITRGIVQRLGRADGVTDLAGQLSLGALVALVSELRLFVGNDSAPAHFATALDVPSVVVFGSAHPSQWAAPNRVWHRAVADETAPCRRFAPPCGCPDDARALCISAVQVADVLTQVEALLNLAPP
jgi:heptosyltransferase-3